MPSSRLDGRRALVTGASRGLGLAAAAALAQVGAHVTLAARDAAALAQLQGAIRTAGGQADTLVLDVTDLPGTAQAIDRARPFDILVNNAGTNRPAAFIDVSVEDFDTVIGLNLRAAFFVAQAVAKKLIEAELAGSIVNVSSQMGHVGGAQRTVYCASKHAIEGLTKAMAIDLAPSQIRVNTLCPTFIETPLTRAFLSNDAFKTDILQRIKLGRLGTIQDMMGAIVFLASDAAALMTGSSLVIDGGWTAD